MRSHTATARDIVSNTGSIVIVGAGHGGTQLAASLREEGFRGSVTLISGEPDLPYHKPPLSKSFMKSGNVPLQPLRGARFFADHDITLRLGTEVAEIERAAGAAVLSDGTCLAYDKLLLATGASARKLTVPGADLAGAYHLCTAEDARAMRSGLPRRGRAVVIGGGFIGLEAAAMLRAGGHDVTVIELAPRLLGRAVSATMSDAVARHLVTEGVTVMCGVGVERILGESTVTAVRLDIGEDWSSPGFVDGYGLRDSSPSVAVLS